MILKIRPLYDKVIIKRKISKENKIIFTKDKKKNNKGEVIAIGKGRILNNGNLLPMDIKVGDVVIFNENYNTREEKINNMKILIVSLNDILAVIEK